MHKKITAMVLTATILISSSSSIVVFADTLQQKLEKQNKELKLSQSKLAESQKIVEEFNSKIEEFDYNIENTMYEIDELNNQIDGIEEKIEQTQKEIEQIKLDMKDEKDLYNKRMSAMYISGKSSFIEVLLGSRSLSDLFTRIQTIKKLTDLDNKLMASLQEKQNELENSNIEMEKETEKLTNTIKILDKKMSKLQKDKEEQKKYIDAAKKEMTAYANVVKADKKQIDKTKRLIAEAKAKEASANKNSNPVSRGNSNVSSNAIIAYASNFLGTPYKWGGNGPNSFDCSGFTKYVFAHFGIKIPRVSRDQARAGKYVPKSQLKPGDLVFFKKPGKPVHHVGIYVGNNSMIHAPQTGDVVKISSLSRRSDYYTARRFK
ncbi:C40 family peptidase [Clostridium sediminicola]|uniref:C40 family peptidase n=1 Tax=Clostridium sediminicola TaxID=3114879 RepID=UPI0031F22ECC